MVKTRMQLQSEGNKRIYRNSFHCVLEILRTEGVRGLYKGLSASYLGVAEGTIQWVIYEHLKTRFAERRRVDQVSLETRPAALVGGKRVGEWVDYLGAAGIAKFIASAITYPHEVLRTRMRQTPARGESLRYTGLRKTFGLILKEEGVGALYGGLTAHMIRVVPNAAIMFFCYEAILHRFS
jgi:solute carrier family 25 protein 33/36